MKYLYKKPSLADFEQFEKISEIKNLSPKLIEVGASISQKTAENFVRLLLPIKNIKDGRLAEIPVNTIGKVITHKGFDISRIIKFMPILYETSVLGWSEPEIRYVGHKYHPNIKEYHHYLNKFTDKRNEYFIRFTLCEERVKKAKIGKNYIHSAFISNVAVYENGDGLQRIREKSPGETNTSPLIDLKLMEFFNFVKYK